MEGGMQCLLDDLRCLEAAQGYVTLGLYMQANRELEQMSADTRLWPEVLAVKLGIFDGLRLWDLVDVTARQLNESANGNIRWLVIAEQARMEMRAAQWREALFARGAGAGKVEWGIA